MMQSPQPDLRENNRISILSISLKAVNGSLNVCTFLSFLFLSQILAIAILVF